MVAAIVGASLVSYAVYELIKGSEKTNEICDYKELKPVTGKGIKCSRNVQLSVKQSNEHILMIAPSGWGKSRSFIMQNVNNDPLKGTIIVTDPSNEIERDCYTNKKKYIFNPFKINSIGYDPLRNCRNEFEVRKLANTLLINGMNSMYDSSNSSQLEWINMSKPLLVSYMLMNYHTKQYRFNEMIKNLCTLPILSDIKRNEEGDIVKVTKSVEYEILSSGVESAISDFRAFKQGIEAKQTIGSIRTVLNSCLQLFFDNSFNHIFKKDSIDLSVLRKEESILIIQVPERHSTYFSPLTASLLMQLFDVFLDNDGVQVYMMFDEMANIGIIPEYAKLLSTARKRCIAVIGAIQSINQVNEIYGEVKGKTLMELFKTLLVCCGLKDSTKYISEILGVIKYYRDDTEITEPLMNPEDVRMMDEDSVLIITGNKRPVVDTKLKNII